MRNAWNKHGAFVGTPSLLSCAAARAVVVSLVDDVPGSRGFDGTGPLPHDVETGFQTRL